MTVLDLTLDSDADTSQKTIRLSGFLNNRKKSYSLLDNSRNFNESINRRNQTTLESSKTDSVKTNYDLVVKNLCKTYGDNQVLKNISETFRAGRISCILGHNGAGKSTLIKILSGLLTRSSGDVSYCGVQNYLENRRMRMKVGLVTTENLLESDFTVYQQMKVICLLKDLQGARERRRRRERQLMEGDEDLDPSADNNLLKKLMDDSIYKKIRKENSSVNYDDSINTFPESEIDNTQSESNSSDYISFKIEKILRKFNLSGFKREKIKNLSEGIKRKLLIAIAFVNNPKLIFLDEPTSTIDSINRKEIWHYIKDYKYGDLYEEIIRRDSKRSRSSLNEIFRFEYMSGDELYKRNLSLLSYFPSCKYIYGLISF